MRAFSIVFGDPLVKVLLKLRYFAANTRSECYFVELIHDCFVEAFNNPVRLRMSHFCFDVFGVIERQIPLVVVMLRLVAILGSSVGQDA